MDALMGVIITIGSLIGIKLWWGYLRMWYGHMMAYKMMLEAGGLGLAKNADINSLMKKALDKAIKKKKNDEDVDDDEVMYQ